MLKLLFTLFPGILIGAGTIGVGLKSRGGRGGGRASLRRMRRVCERAGLQGAPRLLIYSLYSVATRYQGMAMDFSNTLREHFAHLVI